MSTVQLVKFEYAGTLVVKSYFILFTSDFGGQVRNFRVAIDIRISEVGKKFFIHFTCFPDVSNLSKVSM